MTPITVKVKKLEVVVDTDEHPRPETNTEALSKLPAMFRKGGVVTAGNSSVSKRGCIAFHATFKEVVGKLP